MIATRRDEAFWAGSAAALIALLWAVLAASVLVWHPGYAHGDESDVVSFLQRVREGMPWRWVVANGSLSKALIYASMQAFPGRLWTTALPGLLALPLEGALLYFLGRRLAGPRAGFFAVMAGLCTAFSLVRARAGLGFSLFPLEWLALVALRPLCRKPWTAALWGAALGLCLFDYEAWLPVAGLLLAFPLTGPVPKAQRGWELLGLALLLVALLPPQQIQEHLERRRTATLLTPTLSSRSLGWRGAWELFAGGKTLPYLAPFHQGIVPLWALFAVPLGLMAWNGAAWSPLLYVGLGVALVLGGGAPYGLPAHRFVAAWPALALVCGVGLDQAFRRLDAIRTRRLLALALGLACVQQVFAWSSSEALMDPDFRGPIRNLKAAADLAWTQSQAQQLPLVTELHPLKGPQFRFMVGHPLPLPPEHAAKAVAYLPWEYLPALQGKRVAVATLQEEGGKAPGLVALLEGSQAAEALEAERELRPLLTREQLFSLKSRALLGDWLRSHPKAGPWARTQALDYTDYVDLHTGRYGPGNLEAVQREPLVSVRSLLIAAKSTVDTAPDWSRACVARAKALDPSNGAVWDLQEADLRRNGRTAAADALREEARQRAAKGQMLWD